MLGELGGMIQKRTCIRTFLGASVHSRLRLIGHFCAIYLLCRDRVAGLFRAEVVVVVCGHDLSGSYHAVTGRSLEFSYVFSVWD